jgi:hypothetical protein
MDPDSFLAGAILTMFITTVSFIIGKCTLRFNSTRFDKSNRIQLTSIENKLNYVMQQLDEQEMVYFMEDDDSSDTGSDNASNEDEYLSTCEDDESVVTPIIVDYFE